LKEYTLIACISVVVAICLDRVSGVRLFRRGEYYLFLIVITGFKLLVNGYLTGAGIVLYDPLFYLGIRLGSIPLEDFLFGFSMITLSILTWEYVQKERT